MRKVAELRMTYRTTIITEFLDDTAIKRNNKCDRTTTWHKEMKELQNV